MDNLETLVENYLEYCSTQKCLDAKTLKAYRIDLRQFSEQTFPHEVTEITSKTGTNGAKIDTLVSIADVFHVPLDYLVCGCQQKAESASLLAGLNEKEVQFIRNIVLSVIDNMKLIKN